MFLRNTVSISFWVAGNPFLAELSPRHPNLYTMRQAPGLLLKRVSSASELANCDGVVLFDRATHKPLIGYVGRAFRKAQEVSTAALVVGPRDITTSVASAESPLVLTGNPEVVLPGSTWPAASDLLRVRGQVPEDLAAHVGTSSFVQNARGASGRTLQSPKWNRLRYGGVAARAGVPVSSVYMLGVISTAQNGVLKFAEPQLFTAGTPPAGLYDAGAAEDASLVRSTPISLGHLTHEVQVGVAGSVVARNRALLVADAPSGVLPYLNRAIDWYLASAHAKEELYVTLATCFYEQGWRGNHVAEFGLPLPYPALLAIRAANNDSSWLVNAEGKFPRFDDDLAYFPMRVHPVGPDAKTTFISDIAVGHLLGAGVSARSGRVVRPTPVGSTLFEAINRVGALLEVGQDMQVTPGPAPVPVPKPGGGTIPMPSLYAPGFSAWTQTYLESIGGPSVFLTMNQAVRMINRRAEALIKNS